VEDGTRPSVIPLRFIARSSKMSVNEQGFAYENEVIEALKTAGIAGNITEGAGASATGADADFVVDGKRYLLEVKKDPDAQMGGTSVRYDNGEFEIVSDSVDQNTASLIIAALSPKAAAIERLLAAIGGHKFPTTCEKHTWTTAKQKGLLKPINTKIRQTTNFIINHYKDKGIHYMQIGGAGLFYLDENPANLPVPKLDGEIEIELRAGRSGSSLSADGTRRVSGLLRAQGRLKFKGSSPISLDSGETIPDEMKEYIV
jgi:hypothetical protein